MRLSSRRAACAAALWAICAALSQPQAAESAPPNRPVLLRDHARYVIPEGSPLRDRVAVAAVGEEQAPDQVPMPAVVEADPGRSATVLPPFTGRLQRLAVRVGDRVSQGQVLAELSAPDLTQAFADAAKADDALALATRTRDRARTVLEAGGNARKDLEAAESAVVQAGAEQTRADARLRALGFDPARRPDEPVVRLLAPIAGVVTAVAGAAGGFITDPTAPLVTLSNLDQVWVTAQVPEHLLASVRVGQAVEVTLPGLPGETLHGRVASLAPILDADTRRARARIPFANPGGRLRPNMFATATFRIPRGRSVRVPPSALVMVNDAMQVYVEVAPWTFERHTIEVGTEDEHGVRVLAGLRAGERVIVRGGVLLND